MCARKRTRVSFLKTEKPATYYSSGLLAFNKRMADREGFEPSIPLPVYSLSRGALSTTQPPVQWFVCRSAWKEPYCVIFVNTSAVKRDSFFESSLVSSRLSIKIAPACYPSVSTFSVYSQYFASLLALLQSQNKRLLLSSRINWSAASLPSIQSRITCWFRDIREFARTLTLFFTHEMRMDLWTR